MRQDGYPAATMETASASTEEALYSNLSATRVDKPSGYPYDPFLDPNGKVARVRGDGQKIGPAITLKVMAGDRFNLRVSSWYATGGVAPQAPNPLTELVSVLATSFAGVSGGKAAAGELTGSGVLTPGVNSFLSAQPTSSTKPKAYVNWVLFDEQFQYVSSSSGAEQVGGDGELTTHLRNGLPLEKNGYLYVYVSNETPNLDVFFDNLQVTHIRGPLLEETHYYPFGLTMAGISSRAAGGLENKRKFVGQELDSDLDVNWYQFRYRSHDPQIGRFIQVDPLANDYVYNSTYAYAENRPIDGIDLEGLEFWRTVGNILRDGPQSAPAHFGTYILEKKAQYTEALSATVRLSEGSSGESQAQHLPSPVKGTVKAVEAVKDVGSMSQPAVDVLEATNTLASMTPVGEAGLAVEVTSAVAAGAARNSGTRTAVNTAATVETKVSSPTFIVDAGGQVFPVPKGATGPYPTFNKAGVSNGVQFVGGKGGANGQVTTMRIMDPVPAKGKAPGYPYGYVKYTNSGSAGGTPQGVNPYTGQTGSHTATHIPLLPWLPKL